jgi:transketolase
VEAGLTGGWERWIGEEGSAVGLDHFGASAPSETLFEEYGITSERIAAEVRRILASEGT